MMQGEFMKKLLIIVGFILIAINYGCSSQKENDSKIPFETTDTTDLLELQQEEISTEKNDGLENRKIVPYPFQERNLD